MEDVIKVKWLRLTPKAKIPQPAREGDAGADICSCEDLIIEPGERKIVRTGLKVEVPEGFELQIRPRSGLSAKTPLIIPNSPGTIDSGYRGEVGVILWNAGDSPYHVHAGDRIAQVVVQKLPKVIHLEVKKLSKTTRGEGGFGSTGR